MLLRLLTQGPIKLMSGGAHVFKRFTALAFFSLSHRSLYSHACTISPATEGEFSEWK